MIYNHFKSGDLIEVYGDLFDYTGDWAACGDGRVALLLKSDIVHDCLELSYLTVVFEGRELWTLTKHSKKIA